MQSIREYCDKYNRDPSNNFAKACYEQNSIGELQRVSFISDYHGNYWKLSKIEWSDAIDAALNEMLEEVRS